MACGPDLLVFGGHRPWPSTSGQGGANGSSITLRIEIATGRVSELAVRPGLAAPPPRMNHVAAWDAAGQRMLLFGGTQNALVAADLWALEFATAVPRWRKVQTSGAPPPAREFAAAAFDQVRRKWYVGFGQGELALGSLKSDFFVLDAATNHWTQLSTSGPAARTGAAMAVDPSTGVVVLSGGLGAGGGVLGDLWSWDPEAAQPAWQPATASPGPLAWHDFFPDLAPLVATGGSSSQADVLQLTLGETASWERLGVSPEPTRGFLAEAATVNGQGYVWVGEHTDALWRFEPQRRRWTRHSLSGAPAWLEGFSLVGR